MESQVIFLCLFLLGTIIWTYFEEQSSEWPTREVLPPPEAYPGGTKSEWPTREGIGALGP